MKSIFIIKSTLADKEKCLNRENVWQNLYAVETEREARKDCIRFQNKANDDKFSQHYKFIYMYEELHIF